MREIFRTSFVIQNNLLFIACISLLSLPLISCSDTPSGKSESPASSPTESKADPAREAEQVIEKYRALDSSRGSVSNMKVRIVEADGSARTVSMTIYRKRMQDGRRIMMLEFTEPPEERDRNALIEIGPEGQIEATRYVQSNNSFVSTTSVLGEDSLFGMTLQELADGQTEKYEYRMIGEESFESRPVYRLEGTLKPGVESKFPRVVMLVSKENNGVVVAEFYGSGGEMVRRVVIDRFELVGKYWTRMEWTIDNRARQKKLEFETVSVRHDLNISDAIFSRERLKKVSTK